METAFLGRICPELLLIAGEKDLQCNMYGKNKMQLVDIDISVYVMNFLSE